MKQTSKKTEKLAKIVHSQNISITDPFEKVLLKEYKHLRELYLFHATSLWENTPQETTLWKH